MTTNIELTSVHCGNCGGTYAILERYRAYKQQYSEAWHCPYCQISWGYVGNGEVDKLRKENEELLAVSVDAKKKAAELRIKLDQKQIELVHEEKRTAMLRRKLKKKVT